MNDTAENEFSFEVNYISKEGEPDASYSIEEFMKWMNDNFVYGFMKNDGEFEIEPNMQTSLLTEYKLQSFHEMCESRIGISWDQVEFERFFIDIIKDSIYSCESYFIGLFVNDDDGNAQIGNTHTFIVYRKNIWLENAWENYKGIHEYDSNLELLTDVIKKFTNFHNNTSYVLIKYREIESGVNADEFIHKIFDQGERIDLIVDVQNKNEIPVYEATTTSKNKRNKMEKLVYDVFNALDPTGANTKKYFNLFESMSNSQFNSFFRDFFNNDKEYFGVEIIEGERQLLIENAMNASKVLGIELWEHIYLPHQTMDLNNVVKSPTKVLVGYLNCKRTQQLVEKKNGMSISINKRNHMTGQVVDSDKNAQDSSVEATMLVSLGANDILRELHGPRSDDNVMKSKMFEDIAEKGYTQLEDMDYDKTNKQTLTLANTFMLGMNLKTDMITDSYLLPMSIRK